MGWDGNCALNPTVDSIRGEKTTDSELEQVDTVIELWSSFVSDGMSQGREEEQDKAGRFFNLSGTDQAWT